MYKSVRFNKYKILIKSFFAAFIVIALTSCASSHKIAIAEQQTTIAKTAPSRDYSDTGQYIVTTISSENAEAFNNLLNKKALLDRTFQGMSQDDHTDKAREQMDTALDKAGVIITRSLGENTKLTFVQTRLVKEEHRALVRADMSNRGLSYIDFILEKNKDGLIKIVDWHNYAQGQLYSESLRQSLAFMLPRNDSILATILGESWIDSDSMAKFSELAQLALTNNYSNWLVKYSELPERLKYSRIILVTRVLIASAAGSDNEYRSALKDVNTYFGDDPSLSLMLVDHYLNERNYAAAQMSLNRLSEYTGGDAAINLLKANVHLLGKNYNESIKYAKIAISEDSSLEDAYWTLLTVSIHSNHYTIAIDALRDLERRFGYAFDPNEMASIKGYENFASSSIFSDWKYGIIP